jgi:hypothetical protein
VELAFPYRRYVIDANPSLQWVRGGGEVSYRLPRLLLHLAPRFDEALYVSHYDRGDIGLTSYYLLRATSLASLVLLLPRLEVALGGGVDITKAFDATQVQNPWCPVVPVVPGDTSAVRGLGRLTARLQSGSAVLRHDYRSFVTVRLDTASSDAHRWLIDAETTGQLFIVTGRHRFILRGHGRVMAGDVRFWDEASLAGDYQRVYFNSRYWVRQEAQLETAYRIQSWWPSVDFGLFHDVSLFVDRTRPQLPLAAANAFGPSAHLLLFDLVSLDLYVGFGFAPTGFGNAVSFSLQTVF